jgi:hypothetical protein
LEPNEELAGDTGAALALEANVGMAISEANARAAMRAFMIRLHISSRSATGLPPLVYGS